MFSQGVIRPACRRVSPFPVPSSLSVRFSTTDVTDTEPDFLKSDLLLSGKRERTTRLCANEGGGKQTGKKEKDEACVSIMMHSSAETPSGVSRDDLTRGVFSCLLSLHFPSHPRSVSAARSYFSSPVDFDKNTAACQGGSIDGNDG